MDVSTRYSLLPDVSGACGATQMILSCTKPVILISFITL